jgi:hypothetical protein
LAPHLTSTCSKVLSQVLIIELLALFLRLRCVPGEIADNFRVPQSVRAILTPAEPCVSSQPLD